jgi:hypothetical protein
LRFESGLQSQFYDLGFISIVKAAGAIISWRVSFTEIFLLEPYTSFIIRELWVSQYLIDYLRHDGLVKALFYFISEFGLP